MKCQVVAIASYCLITSPCIISGYDCSIEARSRRSGHASVAYLGCWDILSQLAGHDDVFNNLYTYVLLGSTGCDMSVTFSHAMYTRHTVCIS